MHVTFSVLGRIGQLVCTLVLSLTSQLAVAAPGLDHQLREPHYADESLRLVVKDLEVQALGEAPIRIERTWKGGRWVWNERWSDLEVYGAADPEKDASANAGRPWGIRHMGKSYLRAGGGGGGRAAVADPDEDIVLSSLPYRTIIAFKRGLAGYRWLDIYGNRNDYDPKGRMTQYVFYNGIKVSLVRDAEHRLVAVKDHLGETRISFSYDEEGNLVGLKDYSGREVKYEYTDNLLTAVTDVLGQRWEYHYSGSTLTGYSDPLQQRTTLSLSGDKVREYRQPGGRWRQFGYGYEQEDELFYVRQSDQSGLIKEQWFDRLGHEVRRQLNGELQFSREYILSDNSTYVGKVADRMRFATGSSGGGGRSSGGSIAMGEAQSKPEPPYVIKRIEQDARGNRTVTEYNRYQQITRILFADDSEIRRSYDPTSKRVSEEIDERGSKTQYRYDGRGNLAQKIEAAGTAEQYVISYSYDNLSRLITEVHAGSDDTPEARWQYQYDGHGNRTKTVDPLNQETTYSHDVLGNVLGLSNALGKTWSASYDAAGNLLGLTTPLNQTFAYRYDSLGQLTSTIAPNDAELAIEYSAGGLPKSITDAASARTEFEYDAGQRLTAVVDALGNRLQRQYDERGRLKLHQDAAGNRTQYQYDNDRLSGIDFPTYGERYAYDNRDRVTAQTREYPAAGATQSQSEQYRYLRNGLLEQWLDAANNPTGNAYDAQGRVIASHDAEGGVTRFAYDVRGNLTQVADPAGRITRFQYDARDAVIAEIKPGDAGTPRTQRHYRYDAVGNLIETVTPDGRVSRYAYDAANRLIEAHHFASQSLAASDSAERTTTYSYDALSNLQGYEDEDSAAAYEHDALGRVIRTTVIYKSASPAFSKTFSYSYDANGQKASYTNPEQQTYAYRYTGDGQLAGVSIPGEGSLSQQNFNWLQPQQILFPGGSALQLVHDGLLRYSSRTLKDPAGNPILRHTYQYAAVGNITAIEDPDGTIDYGYDKLYRLTAANYPQGDARNNEAYAYDGVGNRLGEGEIRKSHGR
jgi:YD repeat-containing protein